MKKQILSFLLLALVTINSAQVGVNTDTPKTTLDVSAKRDTGGMIADNNQIIGLQAPRVTRQELTDNTAAYGLEQRGALIYITDTTGGNTLGQRINITDSGVEGYQP